MVFDSFKKNVISISIYNLHLWSDTDIISNNIFNLKRHGVDIFCLQEIQKTKGKLFIGDLIQKKLGKNWQIKYLLGNTNRLTDHGLAIVWNTKKIKALQIKKMLLPLYPNSIPFFWIFVRYLTGFNHKEPDQRKLLSIIFKFKNKQFQVINTHIDINGGQSHRLKQHKFIKNQLLSNIKHQIVCGDFNTIGVNNKNEVKEIKKVYGKDFLEASSKISWTQDFYNCPLAFAWLNRLVKIMHFHFRQKLDHILVKGFNLLETKRIEMRGSDHLPIISKLSFSNI